MNSRYFDHKMHATSSARKLITALRSAGGDTKGFMADDLVNTVICGVISLSVKKAALGEEKSAEVFSGLMDTINMKNPVVDMEKFDGAVNVLASAFKTGSVRNDYQFFWNMLKEAMYCVEAEAEEKFGIKLEASTISYHISNAAKEAVGATGLKYASDQLVF